MGIWKRKQQEDGGGNCGKMEEDAVEDGGGKTAKMWEETVRRLKRKQWEDGRGNAGGWRIGWSVEFFFDRTE